MASIITVHVKTRKCFFNNKITLKINIKLLLGYVKQFLIYLHNYFLNLKSRALFQLF